MKRWEGIQDRLTHLAKLATEVRQDIEKFHFLLSVADVRERDPLIVKMVETRLEEVTSIIKDLNYRLERLREPIDPDCGE